MQGKVAIVTGGSGGIGNAFCTALLNEGANVCLCDINELAAEKCLREMPKKFKNNIFFQKCDVTDFNNFKDAFDKTKEKFGKIDLVVNNAGLIDEHDWKHSVDVNIVGVIHGVKLAFQYMGVDKGGSGGAVINTASRVTLHYNSVAPVYCATKYAVVGLTKCYGCNYHLEKSGIRVNAICPGPVQTAFYEDALVKCIDVTEGKKLVKTKVVIKPEELGKALIKLLKDEKNGSLLKVDEFGLQYV